MTPDQQNAILDSMDSKIRSIAQTAYETLINLIRKGYSPQQALSMVSKEFEGEFYSELQQALSIIINKELSVSDIKDLPVSNVSLSDRIYSNSREVNAVAKRIISDQAEGFKEAKDLAMKLYEGYGYKTDPLKVKADLPKYLRQIVRDPAINRGISQVVSRIRADRLKTPALRASYLQAIDAISAGAGDQRISKLLKVAWYERNRYFASRIAQTEAHRSYVRMVANELMADPGVTWVQIKMSATHPRTDICDFHSRVNRYGMGEGCYPKAVAPRPPFHPFCRCKVIPRYDLDGPGRLNKSADMSFIMSLPERDQRMVMGSAAKLNQFLKGTPIKTIINRGVKPDYRLKLLGDDVEVPNVTDKVVNDVVQVIPATNLKAWDPATETGAWHEKSFSNSPDWVRNAVAKYPQAPVKSVPGKGAYCQMRSYINMGKHVKDELRGQSVWRHEYGHWIDGWVGAEHSTLFVSGKAEIAEAIKVDSLRLTTASGVSSARKASALRLEQLKSIYTEESDKLLMIDTLEGKSARIRSRFEALGFDFDEAIRQIVEHDSIHEAALTETGHINDLVRLNKMAAAIEQLDAQGFMDAIIGDTMQYARTSYLGSFPEFSDLIGCATKNKVSGYHKSGFGHDNAYLKRPGYAEAEVFANVFCLNGLGSRFWERLTEVFMPNTLEAIKSFTK